MDRPEAGTVPGGHVLVEALDGISTAEVAELLVHVVGTRPRVVAEPDTEVLNLQGLLFVDLKKRPANKQDCNAGALWSAIPFRLPLEGCKGHQNTYDVDTNDLAIGLLDLFELPAQCWVRVGRSKMAARTSRNTRSATWRRPHWAQRCAYGRSWESARIRWAGGDPRLGTR